MAYRRVVGKFFEYFGNLLVVASVVTFLLGVFGIVDLADAWTAAAFVAFLAGMGIASFGAKLREPRTRRIRSNRVATVSSESGSGVLVATSYATGLYRIKKMDGGRYKPRYRFMVNEAPVILRHNSVTLGSDLEWKLKVSRRRVVLRSKEGSHLAKAIRVRPAENRWVIKDDVTEFKAIVANTKQPHAFDSRTQRRDLTLYHSGDDPEPVASVRLPYEMRSRKSGLLGDRESVGVFDGTMEFSAPVPVAVAALALRLALGQWVLLGPRTGTWEPNYGGA